MSLTADLSGQRALVNAGVERSGKVLGKTDLEISMIMSRGRAAARFHIRNALLKLNAVNRSQSVFKAAQFGDISLAR